MQETESPHPDYLKGFNEGYLLKKHLPELADTLASAVNGSMRDAGFKDGRMQLFYEKEMELLPDWLKRDYSEDRDNYSDKAKDKDDIEPET